MRFESYIPSEEEKRKAEEMMTPEMKAQSDLREKYKVQYGADFSEEPNRLRDDHEGRRECTYKEKERLDAQIEQLADLFADADFFWQLDGALNISMYRNGDYIGIHKDVDISIDEKEIEKVNSYLSKKGYGLFLCSTENNRRKFERVDAQRFISNRTLQPMLITIDEKGKRRYDKEVSCLDTHIIRRNSQDEFIGHEMTKLPQAWYQPKEVIFHGRNLFCSHPSLVAYYKLFHDRAYDITDLKTLVESGMLTVEDIDEVEQVFDLNVKNLWLLITDYTERIFDKIKNLTDADEIFQVLISDEIVKQNYNAHTEKKFKEFAKQILNISPRTKEAIQRMLFEASSISKLLPIKEEKIKIMKANIKEKNDE